jgi:hypothetical protein
MERVRESVMSTEHWVASNEEKGDEKVRQRHQTSMNKDGKADDKK